MVIPFIYDTRTDAADQYAKFMVVTGEFLNVANDEGYVAQVKVNTNVVYIFHYLFKFNHRIDCESEFFSVCAVIKMKNYKRKKILTINFWIQFN